jgi:hypothetical protein
MDIANYTRNRWVFGGRSLIAAFVLFILPFLDSCSRPVNPQEQPKPSKVAVMGPQSPPSQPIPQAQVPAALPFAALAPGLEEVAIPGDARRLDDILQSGHSSSITSVALSPNGKWLASGGLDRSIIF